MGLFDAYMPPDVPSGEIDPRELERAQALAMIRMGLGVAGREPIASATSGAMKAYLLAQSNARQQATAQLQAYKTRQEIGAKAKGDQQSEVLRGDLKGIFDSRIAAPGGPTNANAAIAGNATLAMIAQYRQVAARLVQEGKFEDAKRMSDVADGMEEQYFAPVEVKTPEGQVRLAQYGRRGGERVSQNAPAKPLHFASTGGMAGVGLDPFTGAQVSGGLPVTMDPAQADTSKRGWAQLSQAERHFQSGLASGEIKETSDGFVRIGKDNTVTPITAPGGAQLQAPVPATVKQAIAQNNVNVRLAGEAIAAVKAYPDAFGFGNIVGDTVTSRTDPRGVTARAAVANLSSQKYHDRSGAAVSASESPRLKPFIPDATDPPAVVITKLEGFQRVSALMNQELLNGKPITEVAGIDAGGIDPGIQALIDKAEAAKRAQGVTPR